MDVRNNGGVARHGLIDLGGWPVSGGYVRPFIAAD
jgi:hypothetical protein